MVFPGYESADDTYGTGGDYTGAGSDPAHGIPVDPAEHACEDAGPGTSDKAGDHGTHISYRYDGAGSCHGNSGNVSVNAEGCSHESCQNDIFPFFIIAQQFVEQIAPAYESGNDHDDRKGADHFRKEYGHQKILLSDSL